MSHTVRKVVKVGTSTAIVVPPHVLAHIGVVRGDYVIYDITMPNFALVSRAPIPPYFEAAKKYELETKVPSLIPSPGGTSLDPRLKAAAGRAEDYASKYNLSQDAGSDSGSPPESTSTTTDPTVQARNSSVPVQDAERTAGAVDLVRNRQDELPVSHGLKPGRPSRID